MNREPIFDTVRTMLGRGFNDAEVTSLDEACNLAEGAIAGTAAPTHAPAPAPASHWRMAEPGLRLLKSFEGCARGLGGGKFAAYPDPGSDDHKPWTIGWGATGPGIDEGTVWTQEQADARLVIDMGHRVIDVATLLNGTKSECRFNAGG